MPFEGRLEESCNLSTKPALGHDPTHSYISPIPGDRLYDLKREPDTDEYGTPVTPVRRSEGSIIVARPTPETPSTAIESEPRHENDGLRRQSLRRTIRRWFEHTVASGLHRLETLDVCEFE